MQFEIISSYIVCSRRFILGRKISFYMLPVISTFVDGKMKHDPFDSFLLGSEIKGTEVFVTLELLFVLG